MGQSIARSGCALHRQHQARSDLVAGHEDQLQLQLRCPLRPLHRLPSRDRQDGTGLGHGAGVPGNSARRAGADGRNSTPEESPFTAAPLQRVKARNQTNRRLRQLSSRCTELCWLPTVRSIKDAVTIQVVVPASRAAVAGLQMGDVLQEVNGGAIVTKADVRALFARRGPMGPAAHAEDSTRPGSAVHVAPAARLVCRPQQPAQERRDGLHDLPRRAGQCHRVQMGVAHAERSASGPRLVAQHTVGSTTIIGFSR